jgi:hypothetical protein
MAPAPESPKTPQDEPPAEDVESIRPALKIALETLYGVQDELHRAVVDYENKKERASEAKKRVELLQGDLDRAVGDIRTIQNADTPDPARFPLFDNSAEPAQVTLASSADAMDEWYKARQTATRFGDADLLLTPQIVSILNHYGLHTVYDLQRFFNKGKELHQIKVKDVGSITEARADRITTEIANLGLKWQAEWKAMKSTETSHDSASETGTENGG